MGDVASNEPQANPAPTTATSAPRPPDWDMHGETITTTIGTSTNQAAQTATLTQTPQPEYVQIHGSPPPSESEPSQVGSHGLIDFRTYINYDEGTHNAITIINNPILGSISFDFEIRSGGSLHVDMTDNDYLGVLLLGGGRTLAQAMYHASMSIDDSHLSGRTIAGLHDELWIHWVLYEASRPGGLEVFGPKLGYIVWSSARITDMGHRIPGTPGYDDLAWLFEAFTHMHNQGRHLLFGPFPGNSDRMRYCE